MIPKLKTPSPSFSSSSSTITKKYSKTQLNKKQNYELNNNEIYFPQQIFNNNNNENTKNEVEIKLPKIIINNVVKKNNYLSDEKDDGNLNNETNSVNINSYENEFKNSENVDSDYIDYYYNQNKQVFNLMDPKSMLSEKKIKNKKNKRKVKSDSSTPQSLLLPSKDHIAEDYGKVSYNNLRLCCRDISKNKNSNKNFKVTLKPKNKNSNLKKDQYFNSHSKSTSDVEFYLSSRNNIINNQNLSNYEQAIMNDKIKNVFNYKQMMYLKFNTNQSNDFDSYYNASKMNIMKTMNTLDNVSNPISKLPRLLNGFNVKIRSDYMNNSYYALRLPKLSDEILENNNHTRLVNNILASSNHFQLQHDQIHDLTNKLKDEIDKICLHYPSINQKRKNGKLAKLKTILKENLTKYERITVDDFDSFNQSNQHRYNNHHHHHHHNRQNDVQQHDNDFQISTSNFSQLA